MQYPECIRIKQQVKEYILTHDYLIELIRLVNEEMVVKTDGVLSIVHYGGR
jgi:hypothetical protein